MMPPSAPTAVTMARRTSQYGGWGSGFQNNFSWMAPLSNGGSPITGYVLSWMNGGNVFQTHTVAAGTLTSSFTTQGNNGAQQAQLGYPIHVQAQNAVGLSPPVAI